MIDMTNQNRTKNMAQGWADMAERMTRLNKETMMAGVRGMQPWLDAYNRLFTAAIPTQSCGCRIPETECPPYCACTLDWTMAPGDTRVGHIQIKNTSNEFISYSLAATPLESCEGRTETTPQLEPSAGQVEPGKSLHVQVSVTADKGWRRGDTYESQIKIRGKYERCVCVQVEVACAPEACCKVEMGEIPKSVHADNWTKHFQCTELCFEPIAPPRGVPGQPNDNPNIRG
jgi:hypothetical protein